MRQLLRLSFFMMALLASMMVCVPASHAYLQKHLDYDGCDGCHSYHGSGSGYQLLAGVDTEATCKACHAFNSGAVNAGLAPEAAVHDPAGVGVGNQGYITCRECHDNHSNEGGNTKLVGYDWDPAVDPSKSNVFAGPKIRVELTTSDISSPVYKDVTFVERPDDFKRPAPDSDGVCQVCHNAGPTSGPTVLQDHEWGDCTICHMHEDGFKKRQCVECHDEDALTRFPGAPVDAPTVLNTNLGNPGSHLKLTGGGGTPTGKPGYPVDPSDLDAADTIAWNAWLLTWTERCIQCHAGHSGDVIVPNNNAVGINYQRTGGIGLGGKYKETTGAAEYLSEAEVCWDCHGNGQSEWNALADHGYTVTGGDDWTAVSFNLDGTTVPTVTTRSIHSVNAGLNESVASSVTNNIDWNDSYGNGANALVPHANRVLEDVEDIRCSYCHDVHDLNYASNDTTSGQPYLRGSWLHNPYVATDIERPPESGDSWTGNRWSHFDTGDTVPRLRTDVSSKNTAGGYQIDQNNNYPTSQYLYNGASIPALVDEVTATAGLCVLCHGSNVDEMDYFSTQNLWNSTNGHGNATLGGVGGDAANLFDARNRDGQLSTAMNFFMAGQGADVPNVDQWGNQEPLGPSRSEMLPYGDNADSAEVDNDNESGVTGTPPRFTGYYSSTGARNTDNMPSGYDTWYSSAGIGHANSGSGRAHDFSCSKCHTPHASRLPALLITNCLDYTISDWSVSASGPKNGSSVTLGPSATNRWAKEVMNNCHRKKNTTTGWNVLAPEQ